MARFNFVELLSYALSQLGLTNDTLSNTELEIKDEFLKIIHNCETQQMLNIKTIESAMKNLYAPSDKALVKLMTIHQSKGLEFDSVIIPSLVFSFEKIVLIRALGHLPPYQISYQCLQKHWHKKASINAKKSL
jgi:ATP-dependent exoDNAse (exonuclease V) beta subunit